MATTQRTLPEIPYKAPLTDQNGFISQTWGTWFRQAFIRMGGNIALSNEELELQQSSDIADIEADIATLQTTVGALSSADFDQGTVL